MSCSPMTIIAADDITRELEQIRNRHGKRPLVTSARDAALVELASPIPSVRWRAKQVVKKASRRKAVSGSKHYMRVRKSLKKRVYTFYWSHQEERRFHGWKGHQNGEHVFLTLEEWTMLRSAALAIDKRWALKKRVYTFYWSHQEERRFHGWKGHQSEHVFLTLEEWTALREAALAAKTKSWSLRKRDYNRCWTWDNTYVLIDKYLALDPRTELERPESCPRPDSRFNRPVGKKKGGRPRSLD